MEVSIKEGYLKVGVFIGVCGYAFVKGMFI